MITTPLPAINLINETRELNFIKKSIIFTLFIFLYFILNQLIEGENEVLMLLHFTIFCIFSYILITTFKYIKSTLMKYSTLKLYIGYVVFLPSFHSSRDYYEDKSLRSVGYFDFSSIQYLELFSTVLFFLLLLLITTYFLEKLIFKDFYLKHSNNFKGMKTHSKGLPPLLLIGIILVSAQLLLNIFMFNNKMGIAGISPNDIGFKLTGAIYYYKKFLFPLLVVYITFKYINNKHIILLLILMFFEFIQGSILSASKGAVILHGLPIGYYLLKNKRIYLLSTFTLLMLFMIGFVPIGRNLLYSLELASFHEISILKIIQFNFDQLFAFRESGILELIAEGLKLFLLRMVALKEFTMIYFNTYQPLDPNIFLNTQLKIPFTNKPNWSEYAFFGFDTSVIENRKEEGFTFAYSLGIFSKAYLAERYNVLLLFFLYVIPALLFERFVIKALNRSRASNIFKLIAFYFIAILFIQFFYIIATLFYIIVVIELVASSLGFLASHNKPLYKIKTNLTQSN